MDKREHILVTAIELFGSSGFDNTSIRQISKKAGVNVAMVNYYFGSKEKLFEALIEYKSHYLREKLEELEGNKTLNEMEKINIIIEEYVKRILSHPLYHRIINQEMLLKARPELNAIIEKMISRNARVIKNILAEGMRKKLFRKVDPELTMASVIGTINHVVLKPGLLASSIPGGGETDPLKNDLTAKRIIRHLHQLMRAHLLKTNE